MKYKQFYREVISEIYPNGGFDMSKAEVDAHNTNFKAPVDEAAPCWDGYVQYGMKMKDGREVPNCVPVKKENIFRAKMDALRPLASKKPTEPTAVVKKPLVAPEPKVHELEPLSDEEMQDIMAKYGVNPNQQKEGVVDAIKDVGRLELAKLGKQPGEREKLLAKLKAMKLMRDKQNEEVHDEINEYCPHCLREVIEGKVPEQLGEAEYQGRKVPLGKPVRTPKGPKKFSVYVKNKKGNTVKVNFGDPNMKIKKNIPSRRKSFRARHKCNTANDRTSARYWSCKAW